jgi:hypothetical protein
LVLWDTNGAQDVYQWEAAGAGDCDQSKVTFAPESEGCISLISSGESPQSSEFVDAGVDGRDIFFKTDASLVSPDYGLIDIYDARAGGGLPLQESPPPPCEGDACQSPVGAPADPTPGTSALVGPAGVAPGPTKPPCPRGKRTIRKHGKARCVKKAQKKSKQTQEKGKRSHRQGRADR